ncbi:MAG: hypothetical protein AB1938_28435 [Myxococcota bacterium]
MTFSTTPSGVTFRAQPSCTGASGASVSIPVGQARATIYLSGPAGTYTLSATANGLLGASQPLVIADPPDALVFTTTPPNSILGGTCLPLTLEAQRAGVPHPLLVASTASLTATPANGTRFYSDVGCITSTTSATFAAGSPTSTVYVKPLTGGVNVVTATAAFGMDSVTLNTVRIVRRGSCSFSAPSTTADGGTSEDLSASCSISPAINDPAHTILIIQSTASSDRAGVLQARCRLNNNGDSVQCNRADGNSSGTVHYQVAEIPQGLRTEAFSVTSCAATQTITPAVDPAKSFVLKTLQNNGDIYDNEDTVVAWLTSPTTMSIIGDQCDGYAVQVVEWDGVTVTRAALDGGLPVGARAVTVSGLPPASNARAVLLQPLSPLSTTEPVCDLVVRADVPSPSEVRMSRGATAPDGGTCVGTRLDLYLERIDFGQRAVVQERTVTLLQNDTTEPVTIAPVDVTRTLVFAGTQLGVGQAAGETRQTTPSRLNDVAARFELTAADTVTVTRARSGADTTYTFYVVELVP